MRDLDIRKRLHHELRHRFANDDSTVVIDELGVRQGLARVDVAVVNGRLHGYEIKSARDTLQRLGGQGELYNLVFDDMTVIVSECHLNEVMKRVPDWWGVSVATSVQDDVVLVRVRDGTENPSVDPYALAQLLWRDESLEILRGRSLDAGVRSKPRRFIWKRLAESLSLEDLAFEVRERLKNRPSDWRARPIRA